MKPLFYFLVALLAISCNDDTAVSTTQPQDISPLLVAKGVLSSTDRFSVENRIITTNAQWEELLTNMEAAREGITADFVETSINFNEYQVIASYIIGSSATTIDVTGVTENEDNITVTLENLRKGVTQDVTHPFHIIKIPRSSKPIIFEDLTDWDN